MRNFNFFLNFKFCSQNGCRIFLLIFFHKMVVAAILDDRKSLFIAFLAISDQCAIFFSQNGCRQPFWMTQKSLSIAFLAISDQYATLIFFTKWLPVAILDDRKSLSIAFLTISDQYTTFFEIFFTVRDATVRDATSFLSIFIQNGHQRHILFFRLMPKIMRFL